jgi:hypothetical protein
MASRYTDYATETLRNQNYGEMKVFHYIGIFHVTEHACINLIEQIRGSYK